MQIKLLRLSATATTTSPFHSLQLYERRLQPLRALFERKLQRESVLCGLSDRCPARSPPDLGLGSGLGLGFGIVLGLGLGLGFGTGCTTVEPHTSLCQSWG